MEPQTKTISELNPQSSVLLTIGSKLDKRSVFLESVLPQDEREVTIVLATAASGEELIRGFDESEQSRDHLEVIDGTVDTADDENTQSEIQYMSPISEYLTDLGEEFGHTLDQLDHEMDGQESALQNTVGFYSLGPLLDFADDPEVVFRFCCILLNHIDDAGGRGVFVIEDSYTKNINRLEVLFDKKIGVNLNQDGERTQTLTSPV